jgi:hypothetical protein
MIVPSPAELTEDIAAARERGDIHTVSEMRSQAEALFHQVTKMDLSRHVRLDYQEVCRRADRALGQLIRAGQRNGTIRTRGVTPRSEGWNAASPATFLGTGQTSRKSLQGIYDMCDEVDDLRFEKALAEAREMGSLARAVVTRKLGARSARAGTDKVFNTLFGDGAGQEDWTPDPRDHSMPAAQRRREIIREMAGQGYSSRQMEERLGTQSGTIRRIAGGLGIEIPGDTVTARTRHHDSNKIIAEVAAGLEGLAMSIQMVSPAELDRDKAGAWSASITSSTRAISQMVKQIREETS